MDTKHLIALALVLLSIPAGIIAATLSERIREAAFFFMAAATAVSDRFGVTFFCNYWYRGTTRGLEFTLVDLLALSLLAGCVLAPRRGNPRCFWPASFGLMLLFVAYAAISVACAQPWINGLFELSKMLRGLVVFLAAAFFVRGRRQLGILVVAVACVVCFEGALALKQRLLGGLERVPGTLGHENSYSMYLCLVSPLFVAAATSSLSKWLRPLCFAAIGAAALGIVLTVSRAGVPIFGLVMLGTTVFCVSWRITVKKVAVSALVLLCVSALLGKAWGSLKERYGEANLRDEYLDDQQEGRGYYLRLAKVIVADKPFGIGLNNWSYWVSKKYGVMVGRPYDDYDDLHTNAPDDQTVEDLVWAAPAHNLAALTAGELGWPGLTLFALLWCRWFQMGSRFLFSRVPEPMLRMGVGLFFGVCGIFLQSLTEWTFRQTHIFLMFNLLIGTLASLCYAKQQTRSPIVRLLYALLHGFEHLANPARLPRPRPAGITVSRDLPEPDAARLSSEPCV